MSLNRWWAFIPFALLLLPCTSPGTSSKGVTFFYLDGSGQDFPYVLEHLDDPAVQARLQNLFTGYKNAHVNTIRLLISADHFPSSEYPNLPQTRIDKVNTFLQMTRQGALLGAFQIEVIFGTPTYPSGHPKFGQFKDPYPYTNDQTWLGRWFDSQTFKNNVSRVFIAGDTSPCNYNGYPTLHVVCENEDADIGELHINHGQWLRGMWSWVVSNRQSRNWGYQFGYEAGLTEYETDPGYGLGSPYAEITRRVASWVATQTPGAPVVAGPYYFRYIAGSRWQDYAMRTAKVIYLSQKGSSKPIWIDEFGFNTYTQEFDPNTNQPKYQQRLLDYTDADRAAYVKGLLTATECQAPGLIAGVIAWQGGNNYNLSEHNGFVTAFSPYSPQFTNSWSYISQYYQQPVCPAPSIWQTGVATGSQTWAAWVTGAGFTQGAMVELYDQGGVLWGVNIAAAVPSSNNLTFSLPSNLAPSGCNQTQSCDVQIVVVADGVPSSPYTLTLPPYSQPQPIQITSGGFVGALSPPAFWVTATNLTPGIHVYLSNQSGNSVETQYVLTSDQAGVTFNIPVGFGPYFCSGNALANCVTVRINNAVGNPSNLYEVPLGTSTSSVQISNAGVLYSFNPPVVWMTASGLNANLRVYLGNTYGQAQQTSYILSSDSTFISFNLPAGLSGTACSNGIGTCLRLEAVDANQVPSNVFELRLN